MSKTNHNIGRIIRERRESAGFSQVGLSIISGVSQNTLSRIEAGHDTTISTITAVLNALGIRLTLPFEQVEDLAEFENFAGARRLMGVESE